MIDKQGNRRLQPEEILEGRGPARAHRPSRPNTVASSADGEADVDHGPAAQRSTSLRVIKRDRSLLERCERADNDAGITPGSGNRG
jgi:hypothetical protein